MSIKNLNICSCCSPFIIPLSFDESMSYLEQLCAMLNKLNETIEQVNENTEFIEEYKSFYEEIKAEIEQLKTDFETFKTETLEEIETKFNELETKLITLINNEISVLRLYVDSKANDLQKQIEEIETGKINVYDPTTGTLSSIQTVINNLYESSRNEAITASEFDDLELTAQEFDEKEITAIDFDSKGKTLLTA